jgi:hypothetical protein
MATKRKKRDFWTVGKPYNSRNEVNTTGIELAPPYTGMVRTVGVYLKTPQKPGGRVSVMVHISLWVELEFAYSTPMGEEYQNASYRYSVVRDELTWVKGKATDKQVRSAYGWEYVKDGVKWALRALVNAPADE